MAPKRWVFRRKSPSDNPPTFPRRVTDRIIVAFPNTHIFMQGDLGVITRPKAKYCSAIPWRRFYQMPVLHFGVSLFGQDQKCTARAGASRHAIKASAAKKIKTETGCPLTSSSRCLLEGHLSCGWAFVDAVSNRSIDGLFVRLPVSIFHHDTDSIKRPRCKPDPFVLCHLRSPFVCSEPGPPLLGGSYILRTGWPDGILKR